MPPRALRCPIRKRWISGYHGRPHDCGSSLLPGRIVSSSDASAESRRLSASEGNANARGRHPVDDANSFSDELHGIVLSLRAYGHTAHCLHFYEHCTIFTYCGLGCIPLLICSQYKTLSSVHRCKSANSRIRGFTVEVYSTC